MEEILIKLWPYFERAGVVAGTIMTIMWFLARRELNEERDKAEKQSGQLVTDGKAAVLVIEKNTAAITANSETMREQISLFRAVLINRGMIGDSNHV